MQFPPKMLNSSYHVPGTGYVFQILFIHRLLIKSIIKSLPLFKPGASSLEKACPVIKTGEIKSPDYADSHIHTASRMRYESGYSG
jgi:hypothetical protein